jgi:hypothetical protein
MTAGRNITGMSFAWWTRSSPSRDSAPPTEAQNDGETALKARHGRFGIGLVRESLEKFSYRRPALVAGAWCREERLRRDSGLPDLHTSRARGREILAGPFCRFDLRDPPLVDGELYGAELQCFQFVPDKVSPNKGNRRTHGIHFKIRWVVVKQEALSQHALSIEALGLTFPSALHF